MEPAEVCVSSEDHPAVALSSHHQDLINLQHSITAAKSEGINKVHLRETHAQTSKMSISLSRELMTMGDF